LKPDQRAAGGADFLAADLDVAATGAMAVIAWCTFSS
jgi:hypothetical protein